MTSLCPTLYIFWKSVAHPPVNNLALSISFRQCESGSNSSVVTLLTDQPFSINQPLCLPVPDWPEFLLESSMDSLGFGASSTIDSSWKVSMILDLLAIDRRSGIDVDDVLPMELPIKDINKPSKYSLFNGALVVFLYKSDRNNPSVPVIDINDLPFASEESSSSETVNNVSSSTDCSTPSSEVVVVHTRPGVHSMNSIKSRLLNSNHNPGFKSVDAIVQDANARVEREMALRKLETSRRQALEDDIKKLRDELKAMETACMVATKTANENAEVALAWKERSESWETAYNALNEGKSEDSLSTRMKKPVVSDELIESPRLGTGSDAISPSRASSTTAATSPAAGTRSRALSAVSPPNNVNLTNSAPQNPPPGDTSLLLARVRDADAQATAARNEAETLKAQLSRESSRTRVLKQALAAARTSLGTYVQSLERACVEVESAIQGGIGYHFPREEISFPPGFGSSAAGSGSVSNSNPSSPPKSEQNSSKDKDVEKRDNSTSQLGAVRNLLADSGGFVDGDDASLETASPAISSSHSALARATTAAVSAALKALETSHKEKAAVELELRKLRDQFASEREEIEKRHAAVLKVQEIQLEERAKLVREWEGYATHWEARGREAERVNAEWEKSFASLKGQALESVRETEHLKVEVEMAKAERAQVQSLLDSVSIEAAKMRDYLTSLGHANAVIRLARTSAMMSPASQQKI